MITGSIVSAFEIAGIFLPLRQRYRAHDPIPVVGAIDRKIFETGVVEPHRRDDRELGFDVVGLRMGTFEPVERRAVLGVIALIFVPGGKFLPWHGHEWRTLFRRDERALLLIQPRLLSP